ncbi:MAG: glycosyl transferase family 1 [Pseudomonas sp.]|uniref:glycosyltransferase family 4 protein n=1 Tax=Pseudomonas sp. TaxID=306 RepID=UPI000CA66DFA|nr:glycosyltransferase family 4 protein [Pseudomonas sp.]PJI46794.1 MAG: glycosyl transferase family 1 [Pseudomonas sp.]
MRVLLLNTLYAPHVAGGAEVMLQSLSEGLLRRGHEVQVVCTGPDNGLCRETVHGVAVLRAGLRNLYWPFEEQARGPLKRLAWHALDSYNRGMRRVLERVLEEVEPDIVVCHNLSGWSISAWDAIRAAGLPIVQILHDQYLTCPRSTRFSNGRHCEVQCTSCALLRRPHAEASSEVDAVVGVSRYQLDSLVSAGYFARSRSYVVHNGSPFAPQADDPAPLERHRPLRYGFIGTLAPHKGVEWLLEAFRDALPEASLLIAGRGDPEYVNRLKAQADPHRVHFVGYRKASEFFREIDVAVVPTICHEPFGMVALEACAHHLPVIAARRGGLVEIIHDEVNGLLCNPDEPDSLRVAIQRLAQDPELRRRLALRARGSVESLLSVERMLDEYEAVLRQTLLTCGVHHGSAIPVSTL